MSASKYFSSPELRAPLPGTPERQAAAGGKDDRHDPVSPRAGGGESQPAPESIGSQSSYMTRSQPGHTHNAPAKRRQNTTSLALAELDGSMARSQPVHNASAKLGQAMHHSALGDEGQPESNGSPSGRTSQLTKKRWQSTKSLVLAKLDIRSVTALVQQFNDHIEHGDQGVVASTRVRQAMLEQSGEAFGGIGFSSWLMPAAVAWQIWGCECAVIRTPVSNSNSCCGCLLTRSLARPPTGFFDTFPFIDAFDGQLSCDADAGCQRVGIAALLASNKTSPLSAEHDLFQFGVPAACADCPDPNGLWWGFLLLLLAVSSPRLQLGTFAALPTMLSLSNGPGVGGLDYVGARHPGHPPGLHGPAGGFAPQPAGRDCGDGSGCGRHCRVCGRPLGAGWPLH